MDYQPIIFLSGIGLVGLVVFHGHRTNQDCWLCPYRGWAFMTASVGLGVMLAYKDD